MEASFVLARPDDLELLMQLVGRLRESDPDEGGFDQAAARAAIPALISDPSIGRIWLIRNDDATVGYVVLTLCYSIEFGGRIAFVDELFIDEPHRRRGLGKRVLEFIEEKAAALDVRALLLEVTKSNEAAKGLYRKQRYADRPHQLMVKRIGQRKEPREEPWQNRRQRTSPGTKAPSPARNAKSSWGKRASQSG